MGPRLTFRCTPAQYARLEQHAAAQLGFAIQGTAGNASRDGVEAEWSYDAADGTLEINLASKPWIVSWGYVCGKISDAVDKALAEGQ